MTDQQTPVEAVLPPEADQLELAQARLAELEARATASAEALAQSEAARSQAEAARSLSEAEGLATLRRALIAESGPSIVPELVQGNTAAELEASLETARAAFTRVQESVQAAIAATPIPTGAPPRQADSGAGLSPLAKIAQGLRGSI